jgi:FixJ family two-component response regulator
VPIVLTSGYNEQEATDDFAGRGLAGFLQKPFRYDDLVTMLRAAEAG